MVLAQGVAVTSHMGKSIKVEDLKQIAAAYLFLEAEVPSRKDYFNCNPKQVESSQILTQVMAKA
jgi:hypothetical protein